MRIECNHCGAAYSVADEKVAGRKLKLRCKKCSEPIRVDGTALEGAAPGETPAETPAAEVAMNTVPPPAPADAPFTPPVAAADAFDGPAVSIAPAEDEEEAVWHISVGDTTQGPYTLDELAAYYAQGSILLDTLVFRDGWTDWVPAGEVAEITQAAGATPAAPPPVPTVGAQSLRGANMGADPFSDAAAADPRLSGEQIMSGEQRAEGTVQFSLDEIRAISAVSSPSVAPLPAAAPPPLPGAPQQRPGFASGEASGLVDLKALAAMASVEREEDTAAEAQSSPLDSLAPMALPLAPETPQQDGNLRMKLFAGVAAFGLLLAGGVAALALTYGSSPAPAPAAAAAVAPEPAAPAAAPPPAAAPAPEQAAAAQPAEPAEDAEDAEAEPEAAAAEQSAAAPAPKKAKKSAKARKRKAGGSKSAKQARAPRKSSVGLDDVLADTPKKKAKGGSSSIDDLLDGAISGKSKPKPAPKPEPKSDLPSTPSRDAMLKAFGKAKAKVKRCKGDGVATASITLAGSGEVKSVSVSGVSGPAKGCVEKAVKATRFPKFSKPTFQVKFPFKL